MAESDKKPGKDPGRASAAEKGGGAAAVGKGGRTSAAKPSLAALEAEFRDRMTHLRGAIRREAEGVADKMEAVVAQLADEAQSLDASARRRKFYQSALRETRQLKIKPHKRRLRDLKRIDELLERLGRILNELQ
jgi:hypothetical protein